MAFGENKTEIVKFRTTKEMKQKLVFVANYQKNTLTGAIEILIDKEHEKITSKHFKTEK